MGSDGARQDLAGMLTSCQEHPGGLVAGLGWLLSSSGQEEQQELSTKGFQPAPVAHLCRSLLSVESSTPSSDSLLLHQLHLFAWGSRERQSCAPNQHCFAPCVWAELFLPQGFVTWSDWGTADTTGADGHLRVTLSLTHSFLNPCPNARLRMQDYAALTFSCPCWTSQDVQSRHWVPADAPDLALIPIVGAPAAGETNSVCREGSGYKRLEWSKQVLGRLCEESTALIPCRLSLTPACLQSTGGTSAGEAVCPACEVRRQHPLSSGTSAAVRVGRVPTEQEWGWVSAVGAGGPPLSQGGRSCRSSACWPDSGPNGWCDFCLKAASPGSDVRQEAHFGTAAMVSLPAARLSLSGW